MTSDLIVQAINIAILVGFGLVLVLRTRAEFGRKIRELEARMPATPTPEQKKLELRAKIELLQRELAELDRTPMAGA